MILPRIAGEVPTQFDIMLTSGNAARIARALLDAGILEESDWTGAIGTSLQEGLQRWLWRLLEDEPLKRLNVHLAFADDLADCWLLDCADWARKVLEHPREEVWDSEVGGFVLVFDMGVVIFVQEAVERLERIQTRLGFNILYLLCYALRIVVGCQDPSITRDILEQWDLMKYEGDGRDDLTEVDEFDVMVPKKARNGSFAPSALSRARKLRIRAPWLFSEIDSQILDLACELDAIFNARNAHNFPGALNQVGACLIERPSATAVGWVSDDDTERVYDEELDLCAQVDCTSVIWVQGFVLDRDGNGPGTLANAVYNLDCAMRALVLCDRLMSLMDTQPKTLIRLFSGEGCR